jgi:hypothetical protein
VNDRGLLAPHAPTLRAIIESVGVAALADIIRQPGVSAVYRLTVYHHDGRARDTVSTLIHAPVSGSRLETVVRLMFGGKPLVYNVLPRRYEHFVNRLNAANFDQLGDQPSLPPYGADLWLLERAAGSFNKSLILAPDRAEGVYASLVAAVRDHLPEALREVR